MLKRHNYNFNNKNVMLSNYDLIEGKIPKNLICGKYTSDEERFRRSLSAKQKSSELSYDWIVSGEENSIYGKRRIFNESTGERRLICEGDGLPKGFTFSVGMSEEHKNKLIKNGKDRRGKPRPDVALFHTGRKRDDSTKSKMKKKKKEFFDNGGTVANKGTIRVFNTLTRNFIYIKPYDIPMYENDENVYFGSLMKLRDSNNTVIYITPHEAIPEGFIRGR